MARTPARLRLSPELCDHCGACMEQCETGALKVGLSYIYVDWRSCGGCLACVKACKSGAIQAHVARAEPRRRASGTMGTRGRRATGARANSNARSSKTASRGKQPASAQKAKRSQKSLPAGASWTFREAAVVLAVVLLAFVAKDAALTTSFVRGLSGSMGLFVRVLILGFFYAVQLAPLFVLARSRGGFASAFGLDRGHGPWWRAIVTGGLTLSMLLLTRLFTTVYGALVQYFGWDPPMSSNASLTEVFGSGSVGLVVAVLLVVFVGPLVEEVVFRSVLLSAFREQWGAWAGVLVSATLFGMYHFSAWMFLPTFALGLALGWLAHSRQGLWPPLVLHALYNGVAVAAAFYVAG